RTVIIARIAREHADFRETARNPVNKGDCFRRKSLESEGGHTWREYTYRKITPCDACGQVLRGHSRQGVRCRGCKANAHTDCINMVQPALCPSLAPKKGGGIPLLRRQKTQVPADEVPASSEHNVDAIYQVLKQAGEIRGNSTNSPPTPPTAEHPPSGAAPSSARASSHPCSSSTSGKAHHQEFLPTLERTSEPRKFSHVQWRIACPTFAGISRRGEARTSYSRISLSDFILFISLLILNFVKFY
ncbi:SH3 and cysteine-rich domain-containing protein 3-like, partial [Temnothorax curvispinosus]|uniref:SH3 and cysteine-rich domain-containing protein 3-like n=1 Tax=Temnothorax curvispinosus TaxID=300111 RepID=A0A6J1R7P9_9HYME